MDYIHIKKDTTFINELEKSLKTEGPFSKWHLFQMRYQAELMTISPKFSGLRVLEYIPHVKFLPHQDRKSTRLNSSHVAISYAVFCLKKKNTIKTYKHSI